MADKCTPCLLVTANVGSIFEDPDASVKVWTSEFLNMVKKLQPHFLALHCQEVGGKQFEQTMKNVEEFVRILMASNELMQFDRIRIFLDEDFSSEKFTALGNFYFIHECVKTIQIWDFKARTFVPVLGKEMHSGNIENVTTKEKSKFPADLFPECKRSRKGYLRTRWYLNGSAFDLVNIHLFHDASNFIALERTPSIFSEHRKKAMSHMLDTFNCDDYEKVPLFIFGDFNFRLNAQGVVGRLTHKTITQHIKNSKNGEVNRIVYREANDKKVILTLGKKEFDHFDHDHIFTMDSGQWLREYDIELQSFMDRLFEYEITFCPSYPFAENIDCGRSYMKTRCPAWCDRVLLSTSALSLVYNNPDDLENSQVLYHVLGSEVCMGDHKPVYLMFRLVWNSGMDTHRDAACNGLQAPLVLRPLTCDKGDCTPLARNKTAHWHDSCIIDGALSRTTPSLSTIMSDNFVTPESSPVDEWATPSETSLCSPQAHEETHGVVREEKAHASETSGTCSGGCECGRCSIL